MLCNFVKKNSSGFSLPLSNYFFKVLIVIKILCHFMTRSPFNNLKFIVQLIISCSHSVL